MANLKTPGVYIEEIPTLGSSIAPVATAIPGFTGYTETAIINGAQWNYANGPAPAVRITSLLQYAQIFGQPYHENYEVTLQDPTPQIAIARNTPVAQQNYVLYYQMQMFFANGGSVCWVVSVGDYTASVLPTPLVNGLAVFEGIDEVTLLLVPDAFSLSASQRKQINDTMLIQCAKLGDRFAVIDVFERNGDPSNDCSMFRSNDVGPDNLKYGAAYYPPLNTLINYFYKDDEVLINDTRGTNPFATFPNNTLETIQNGIQNFLTIDFTGDLSAGQTFTIEGITFKSTGAPNFLAHEFNGATGTASTNAANFEDALKRAGFADLLISRDIANPANVGIRVANFTNTVGFVSNFTSVTFSTPSGNNLTGGNPNSSDKNLYNTIKNILNGYLLKLYPGGSMVGIYSRVDNARGVWQSPANVGVSSIDVPAVLITDLEQQDMNIDSVSGKSINAIRKFNGRGNIVWGARTLAGNDNEWRYINVRRLFIMIEESVKNATEFVVFEPNAAATWQRVKGMIEAFLTDLWRDGALAGAVPSDAFFVQVGLGTTMTADDILNGIMNVRIGIAAVRPAEFIILEFSHKIQVS